ncbi:MAG: hypothetical protein WCC74_00500 [Minisyncoccia bacterium]
MKNKFRKIVVWVLPTLFFLPVLAFAAGFVPCNGTPDDPCTFDSLIIMVNAILKWFISIAFVLAAIGFAFSGAKIVMSAGNPAELSKARAMFWSILKGILFVAGAWLIVYTIMSTLTDGNSTFLKFLK